MSKETHRRATTSEPGPKYFIVKHGLDAFHALPHYIWNTGHSEFNRPRGYGGISKADHWIAYAYTTSDAREKPLNLITGFYECVEEAFYGDIPLKGLAVSDGKEKAWMIKGKKDGEQPDWDVAVPSIRQLLGRNVFNQAVPDRDPQVRVRRH